MPSVPLLKPREVVKTFEGFGWEVARQRGSHIILTKEAHIATLSVPNHAHVARRPAKPHCQSRSHRGRVCERDQEMSMTSRSCQVRPTIASWL